MSGSPAMRTNDQRRAAAALEAVRSVRAGDAKIAADYRSYVAALPASILSNGLGQAVATLLAQARGKDTAHRRLYEHLSAWLCGGDRDSPYPVGCLLDHLTEHDQQAYVHAQGEALAYLDWLKKFATAFLAGREEPNE